jgi:hypothetical protein
MDDREIRSASGAARPDSGAGREGEKVGIRWACWILTDGNVLVAGELPRQCPRCRRAHFDPRSALRAQIGLFGEGRRIPVGLIGSRIDGSVRSAGELTSIRVRRCAPPSWTAGEA